MKAFIVAATAWLVCLASVQALSRDDIAALCARFPNSTMTVGMVTKGNTELTLRRWRPTFEDYLSSSLASYGCRSKLVPLQFDTYENMTANGEVDFVFPNPTAFQELKDKYNIHEFLSVKRNFGADQELDRFGGVIVRAAARHTAIVEVADLLTHGQGLTVCGVNSNAFGGWHIQWLEMLRAGIDVHSHFTLEFLGNYEDPIRALLTGECDIGIARSETVERLVSLGEFNASQVFTIGERGAEFNFPQRLTTPLYPEWPLASLAHVPRDLEQLVAVPLLTLRKDNPAAIAGDHAGFAFPYSYEPVRKLFLALDHYGTGECDPGFFRQEEFPRQCLECPAGSFSDDGLGSCVLCPVGFVNNGTGNTDCDFCPSGMITTSPGGTPADCIAPASSEASVWEDPGTWVNIGVAVVAVLAVVGMTMYAKRRSGSLLVALELLARGILPNVLAFAVELSDLASDIACALAILVLRDVGGVTPFLRTLYVCCVAAHIVPSLLNLAARAKNLLEAVRAGNAEAKVAVEPLEQGSDPPGSGVHKDSETAGGEDLVKRTEVSLRSVIERERAFVEKNVRAARSKGRTMLPLIVGLVFEDFLMSIVNCITLAVGNRSEDFRNHALFPLLALAAASSLVNFGFKVGHIGRWLTEGRRSARIARHRLKTLTDLQPNLDTSSTLDVASVLQTHEQGGSVSTITKLASMTFSRASTRSLLRTQSSMRDGPTELVSDTSHAVSSP